MSEVENQDIERALRVSQQEAEGTHIHFTLEKLFFFFFSRTSTAHFWVDEGSNSQLFPLRPSPAFPPVAGNTHDTRVERVVSSF